MDDRETFERAVSGAESAPAETRYTVVALFEDTIDAEHALVALRKADYAPERISVLVRDRDASDDAEADSHGAVARAVVANALGAVGGWLQGLASLIVPDRGSFLVAGPIGAALAGKRSDQRFDDMGVPSYSATTVSTVDLTNWGLLHTLEEFGFNTDEATYLEHRLAAGTALVALTSASPPLSLAGRRIFADHNAVYIGVAQTTADVLAEAEALLAAAPEDSTSGDMVVTDAVALLIRACHDHDAPTELAALCGRDVIDRDGEEIGAVEEILAGESHAGGVVLRYVVVGFGGLLGLGRQRVPVPVGLADLSGDPIRLSVDKAMVHKATRFVEDVPFSRADEQSACAYFGTTPYWIEEADAAEA